MNVMSPRFAPLISPHLTLQVRHGVYVWNRNQSGIFFIIVLSHLLTDL